MVKPSISLQATQALRRLGRHLPEQINVATDGQEENLSIGTASRHLLGRRLAGAGVWKERAVFIKLFFGKHKAQKEFKRELKMSLALAAGEISAPRLLGFGGIKGGGFWLAQDLLPEPQSFKAQWLESDSLSDKCLLFEELLTLLNAMYRSGLYQADAHMENFAFSAGKIYVLDAGGIKRAVLFKEYFLLRNLGVLLAQFSWQFHSQLIDLSSRLLSGFSGRGVEGLPDVVARAWRNRIRKLSYKMLRTSSWVSRFKGDRVRVLCMRTKSTPELANLLASCLRLDEAIDRGVILKRGNSATVAKIELSGVSYIVKRYNIKNRWVAVKRAFGRSRARKSWLGGHALTLMGVPTSEPVAIVEERRWGMLSRAYFMSAIVPGEDAYHSLSDESCDEGLAKTFSDVFEVLAYTRVSHGDMKATNFLINKGKVSLIDLDAVNIHRYNVLFKRVFRKDLNRFLENWGAMPQLKKLFTPVVRCVIKNYKL